MKKKTTTAHKDGSATPKKSRMKEAKETRLLFETIAKKLLTECTSNSNHKLEEFCTDLIIKKFTELRQDVVIMDTTLSARISQIENKVNDFGTKLSDLTTDLMKQNTLLREDVTKISQQSQEGLESERQKRLATTKKLQSIVESQNEHCKAMVTAGCKECMGAVTSLNEDFRVQSKEITRLKESVDDVLLKRYGFIPNTTHKLKGEDLAATFNQGLDAGVILDNLAQRINKLELQVADDEWEDRGNIGLDSSFQRHNNHNRSGASSPIRSLAGGHTFSNTTTGSGNITKTLAIQKFRRLEESIYDLRAHLQATESDINEVKSMVISKLRNNSPQKGNYNSNFSRFHENNYEESNNKDTEQTNYTNNSTEIRILQKKIKKLAENTTRACRSLSTGVSDIQQATLNLYTWTDTAYDAFGKISNELGFKSNLCTRARVYQPESTARLTPAALSDLLRD